MGFPAPAVLIIISYRTTTGGFLFLLPRTLNSCCAPYSMSKVRFRSQKRLMCNVWAHRSLTHLLVTFPLETRDSRIVLLHSTQLIRLVEDTSSFNQSYFVGRKINCASLAFKEASKSNKNLNFAPIEALVPRKICKTVNGWQWWVAGIRTH